MSELEIYQNVPHGDMPGDQVKIEQNHVDKAKLIYPVLSELIRENESGGSGGKQVIAVCGGSGVGKSEIASLLAYLFGEDGLKAYVMSGDNYPHRIPSENDGKRLEVYEKGGREALEAYLGSEQEIDFKLVEDIIRRFKAGQESIEMKRMGRSAGEIWFDSVDMSDTQLLILEWTHSNSDHFQGVDIPILLNSTPQETLEHRRTRNRDGAVDSPFTTMVLEIEQNQLKSQAHKAKIIVTKDKRLIDYEEYCGIMNS